MTWSKKTIFRTRSSRVKSIVASTRSGKLGDELPTNLLVEGVPQKAPEEASLARTTYKKPSGGVFPQSSHTVKEINTLTRSSEDLGRESLVAASPE